MLEQNEVESNEHVKIFKRTYMVAISRFVELQQAVKAWNGSSETGTSKTYLKNTQRLLYMQSELVIGGS